jgi:protein involved in polysaccharide export with SLBB domain
MRFLLLCGLLAVMSHEAQAQVVTASPQVAVYRYAVPGQPTMDVRVWGAVRTPGTYQVELDQDLIGVLTMAGGPAYSREQGNEEREVTIRLSRTTDAARTVIYEAPLEQLFGAQSNYPSLQDGDIVTVDVEYQQRFGWRDAATIFSSIGTVAVIVLNIIRLSE